MATGKRYYWIKLKTSFMTSDAVDFLMGQPDGANYVVLYQMLCLKTINTGGKLERQIGEIIVPYDEAKIERDCKWFSIDTIHVALNLYKRLGLIYVDNNGVLCLTGHADLIGSETDYASQKREQRIGKETLQALPEVSVDNTMDNCVDSGVDSTVDSGVDIVHTEIEYRDRDKSIDYRDNNIDINKELSKEEKVKKEEKSEKPTAKEKILDIFNRFAGYDDELALALQSFAEMRKAIKKPLTVNAANLVCKKLKEFPQSDWIEIINQSIMNSWQGIFPLNYGHGNGGQKYGRREREASVERSARLIREGAFKE